MFRLPFLLLLISFLCACQAHAYDVLCRNGDTRFHSYFHTGVEVNIGPPTEEELAAARTCRAALSWDDGDVVVAEGAAEVDLDLFGVDPGVGVPVAAFQVKDTEHACCMTYKIYSLEEPPRLLRTLKGGGYFSAADTNLDGQVEIWTNDTGAVDGFEGVRATEMQFPPMCVLRFNDGKLLDVSSEFQSYFDQAITTLRAQIQPGELEQFKLSDGKRPDSVKSRVLQIVWAYLYSDREKQAWKALAEMWPASDLARIRTAIEQERARGLRAQVDGVSRAIPPQEPDHVRIYDSAKTPAQPIMVRYYPPAGGNTLRGKLRVSLVVDLAGKVWSLRVSGKNKAAYEYVKKSAANWKFVPAFVDDQPVASRVHMTISLAQ